MIYDGRGRGYIFGKTFMDSSDINKWLDIDEFANGIDELRGNNEDINDATVLRLINQIIEKHSSDADDSFPMEWAIASANKFRKKIPKAYFDKNWLKEKFPDAWNSVQAIVEDGAVIIPFQMHKYVCFLKFFSDRADKYGLEIRADGFDKEKHSAQITVLLTRLFLDQIDGVTSLMKHMARCSVLEINALDGKAEIRMTVPNVLMSREEFDKAKANRAWTLQWNQRFISQDMDAPLESVDWEDDEAEEDSPETEKVLAGVVNVDDEVQQFLVGLLPLREQEISYWRKASLFDSAVRKSVLQNEELTRRQVLELMTKVIRLYAGTGTVDKADKDVLIEIRNRLKDRLE